MTGPFKRTAMASRKQQPFSPSQPAFRLLRPRSSTRPALWVLPRAKRDVVVKDYRCNGVLFRNTAGRFLVWREAKVLRRLQGIEGIPALYGKVDGLALIMEALPGRSVEGLEHENPLPLDFFHRLRALVHTFHARGVAHCDLKRAPNVLVGKDHEPYVVDWSAAITASEFRPFPLSLLYRRFLLDDQNAVVKLQLRHRPRNIPPGERSRYQRRSPLERIARRVRDRARELLQRLA